MEGYSAHMNLLFEHLTQFHQKVKEFLPRRPKRISSKYSGYLRLFRRRRILSLNEKIPVIEALRKKEIEKMR